MSQPRTIRFLFDYISPNAYLAWTQLGSLAERHACSVQPVAVLYAAMLNAQGTLGPAEVRPKRDWMWRNVLRKAVDLGVALRPPSSHPFNPLLALRVSSLEMESAIRWRLIDALFTAVWADGRDATDPRTVAAIASEAGLDGARAVERAGEPEAKQRLIDRTGEAIHRGVFGVPTLIVGAELFWGYDDYPYLERFLRDEDPLDRAAFAAWSAVKPSADRRRRGG